MNQQIPVEDALAVFRKRHGELADTNALLEARAAGLERRISELEGENSRLMKELEVFGVQPAVPVTSEC
jgi:hypothetical protein